MVARKKMDFIKGAIKKPGALHKALGVPADKPIPASKLQPKPGDSTKMKRRKALARTLKKMG
jgi:hypothetical protein